MREKGSDKEFSPAIKDSPSLHNQHKQLMIIIIILFTSCYFETPPFEPIMKTLQRFHCRIRLRKWVCPEGNSISEFQHYA